MITKKTQRSRIVLACLLLASGCAHLYDPFDESVSCLHCEVAAAKTWHGLRSQYAHVNYPHHFGAGFRAGYANVCRGRGECPPTLPPKSYWTVWYRNPAGREKAVEWFNGYSAGAAVAVQQGYASSGELVTAPGSAGTCDCYGSTLEYELPEVQPPSVAPTTGPPVNERLEPVWEIPQTEPVLPRSPESVDQFPAAPRIQAPPEVNRPESTQDSAGTSNTESPSVAVPQSDSEPSSAPDAETTDLSSDPMPFGHSIGPASPYLNSAGAVSKPPSPDVSPGSPPRASPKGPVEDIPGPPDASDPLNESPSVPDYQAIPKNELPYLEDRFLPRGGPHSPAGASSSRQSRPPRSLMEAIGRVQHTSHIAH